MSLPEPLSEEPGLEAHRATIVEALKSAVRHKMDLDTYESALRRVMDARSSGELANIARSLPLLELAVPGATVGEAVIQTGIGIQRRRGRWPVAARTTVDTGLGSCWLDFTDAVFDDRVTDLRVTTGIGFVRLAIPPWIAVEFASVVGGVSCAFGHEAAAVGLPVIRLHANAKGGTIRLRRPRSLR